MKRLLTTLFLMLAPVLGHAITYQSVRASTSTAINPGLQTGTMNLSSGTIQNLNSTNFAPQFLTVGSTATIPILQASTVTVTNSFTAQSSATVNGNFGVKGNVNQPLTVTSSATFTGNVGINGVVNQPLTVTSSVTVNSDSVITGTATFTGRISTSSVSGTGFGSSGMALLSSGPTAAPTWGYRGQQFNVQSFTVTSASSTNVSTNFARMGLKVTITPQVATDSITVVVDCGWYASSWNSDNFATIWRNSTNIGDSTRGLKYGGNTGSAFAGEFPLTIYAIDWPNSTSAQTYELGIKTTAASLIINDGPSNCRIYAWEIGG